MNNSKPTISCQEKTKNQTLNNNFARGASFTRAQTQAKIAYLTNTDKSDSKLQKTPVIGTKFLDEFSAENQRYFLEKSKILFNETKHLLAHDKQALKQIHQLGFQKLRFINNDTIVIYTNFNQAGRADCGWQMAQNNSNSDKARLSSKQLAYERALANNDIWSYFATFTFDKTKQDRHDFDKLLSRITTFLRRREIKYFLVPELHKKGGIHFHALLSKEIEPYLSDFADTAPKALKNPYIAQELAAGREIKNCADISATYGYTTIQPIRDVDSCVHYLTKYVLKTFDDENFTRISRRRFFCSKGLKSPKVILPHQIDLEHFDLVALSSHTQKIYLKRATKQLRQKGISLGSMATNERKRFSFGVVPFSIKQPEHSSA